MPVNYEVITDARFDTQSIKKIDENGHEFWIPMDPENIDYQAYLEYLDETKTK